MFTTYGGENKKWAYKIWFFPHCYCCLLERAMFEISDKGLPKRSCRDPWCQPSWTWQDRRTGKLGRFKSKTGWGQGAYCWPEKTQWGVQQVHRWVSRKPDSRNKGLTRREQWEIDGEKARWRPAQQPGFLLLMRHAEGLLPEPHWPLQLWAGLPAARCWTRQTFSLPRKSPCPDPAPKDPNTVAWRNFWNCNMVYIGQILTDCVQNKYIAALQNKNSKGKPTSSESFSTSRHWENNGLEGLLAQPEPLTLFS